MTYCTTPEICIDFLHLLVSRIAACKLRNYGNVIISPWAGPNYPMCTVCTCTVGPTTEEAPPRWQTWKIVVDVFLEIDIPHCGYCFKSFSLCILVQFSTARRMVELTSALGAGSHVSPRFGLIGIPVTLLTPKMEWFRLLLPNKLRVATSNAEIVNWNAPKCVWRPGGERG